MAGTAVFEWKIGKLREKSPKESTKNTRTANGCQQKFKVSHIFTIIPSREGIINMFCD